MLVPGASAKTEVHLDAAVAVWHNDIMLNCIMVPVNTGESTGSDLCLGVRVGVGVGVGMGVGVSGWGGRSL